MPVKKGSRVKDQGSKSVKNVIPADAGQKSKSRSKLDPGLRRDDRKRNLDDTLIVPVYSLAGKEDGTLELPKEVFGGKVNKTLLAQAMRVYVSNKKEFTGSTKTRGEVNATTKKAYNQKGTGGARHGAKSAPIYVGGGIAFGPKPRKVKLDLPKKMKKAALIAALSARAVEKGIIGLSGLEKADGKTKQMANLVNQLAAVNYKNILIVTADKNDNVVRAVKNLPKVDAMTVSGLNAYEVISHKVLAVTKDAIGRVKGLGEDKKGEVE